VLALHYIVDLAGLLGRIHAALAPGGRLVVHMEHPIFMAPSRPGFAKDGKGRRAWPLDRYLEEGPRTTNWLAPGVVKQHRMLSTTLNHVMGAGFTLERLEEWWPSDAAIAQTPQMAEERDRPMFLFFAARR